MFSGPSERPRQHPAYQYLATLVLAAPLSSPQSMTDYYNKRTPPKNPFDYFRYRGGRPRPDSDDKIDPFGESLTIYLPEHPLLQQSISVETESRQFSVLHCRYRFLLASSEEVPVFQRLQPPILDSMQPVSRFS